MDVFLLSEGTEYRASKVSCVQSFLCSCNTAALLAWVSLDVWLLARLKHPGTQQLLSCNFFLTYNNKKKPKPDNNKNQIKKIQLDLHLIHQEKTSWKRDLYSKLMFETILWEDITKPWPMLYSGMKARAIGPNLLMDCSASRKSYLLVTRQNCPCNTWIFCPLNM